MLAFFLHGLVFIVHWLQSSLERLRNRYIDSTLEKGVDTQIEQNKIVKMTYQCSWHKLDN